MRLLLAPRMLALHALVLAVVVTLANLGLWQLSRLDEVRARNDAAEAALASEELPVEQVLSGLTLDDTEQLAALAYTPVQLVGAWRVEQELLQRGRPHRGQAGLHVLTPFALDDGGIVLVRRGSVPFDNDLRPPVAQAAPSDADRVVVTGYLERSIPQPTSGIAQRDPDEGELEIIFNTDLARLAPQLGGEVLPMLVVMTSEAPPSSSELPLPIGPPQLDDGPHLSYAIQWFSFATIAVLMYALWLRRRVRGDSRAVSAEL